MPPYPPPTRLTNPRTRGHRNQNRPTTTRHASIHHCTRPVRCVHERTTRIGTRDPTARRARATPSRRQPAVGPDTETWSDERPDADRADAPDTHTIRGCGRRAPVQRAARRTATPPDRGIQTVPGHADRGTRFAACVTLCQPHTLYTRPGRASTGGDGQGQAGRRRPPVHLNESLKARVAVSDRVLGASRQLLRDAPPLVPILAHHVHDRLVLLPRPAHAFGLGPLGVDAAASAVGTPVEGPTRRRLAAKDV